VSRNLLRLKKLKRKGIGGLNEDKSGYWKGGRGGGRCEKKKRRTASGRSWRNLLGRFPRRKGCISLKKRRGPFREELEHSLNQQKRKKGQEVKHKPSRKITSVCPWGRENCNKSAATLSVGLGGIKKKNRGEARKGERREKNYSWRKSLHLIVRKKRMSIEKKHVLVVEKKKNSNTGKGERENGGQKKPFWKTA